MQKEVGVAEKDVGGGASAPAVALSTAIIGGGPAALAAALYLARAGKKVRVFERGEVGGELARIDRIENYPGYSGPGRELAAVMRRQAEAAGAEVAYGECTKIVRRKAGDFVLTVDDETIEAETVLVATGSEPRRLNLELTKPVSYCALCDGVLTKGKKVVVVGGGNSALQGVLYLAAIAEEVTLISHSKIKADTFLRRKVCELTNVAVREDVEPTAAMLDEFDHVFVFIGTRPATKWLRSLRNEKIIDKEMKFAKFEVTKKYELFDSKGYILTGGRKRSAHATEIPGLYAAGDVRSGATKQVATATGDGVDAALEIIDWLK